VTWIVAAASLFATWLNVRGHVECFWIWTFSNAVWAGICFAHDLPAQGCLHVVYLGLAVWGLQRWRDNSPAAAAARDDTARTPESPP